MGIIIKNFEAEQLDWWLSYYRQGRNDLALRLRSYLDGNLQEGVLLALLEGIEKDITGCENLD